jgi:PIN domain nuclease of toxin-antitoxin system
VILLDTHVVLWLLSNSAQLSTPAKNAIADARQKGEPLAICGMTLLELATLWSKSRIQIKGALEQVITEIERHFVVLPITGRACARIPGLPASYPKDPADRIIGATALVEGLVLVTADRAIRRSRAFRTIW